MDIMEIRRQQLRKLVGEHEGMRNLARKLGLTKGAYISQLLSDPPLRTISEKTARKWEKILKLPDGWLDARGQESTFASPPALNAGLLTQVLTEVMGALKAAKVTLTDAQLSDLIVMQYTDALPAGRVDPDRIRKIVGLLKR